MCRLGVKAELVDVKLQRIGRQRVAVGQRVIDDLVALGRLVYSVEAASQEGWTTMQAELFLEQVRRRELPSVGFPVTGQQRPPLLVLALRQRPRGIVVVALEVGEKSIEGDAGDGTRGSAPVCWFFRFW